MFSVSNEFRQNPRILRRTLEFSNLFCATTDAAKSATTDFVTMMASARPSPGSVSSEIRLVSVFGVRTQ